MSITELMILKDLTLILFAMILYVFGLKLTQNLKTSYVLVYTDIPPQTQKILESILSLVFKGHLMKTNLSLSMVDFNINLLNYDTHEQTREFSIQ